MTREAEMLVQTVDTNFFRFSPATCRLTNRAPFINYKMFEASGNIYYTKCDNI